MENRILSIRSLGPGRDPRAGGEFLHVLARKDWLFALGFGAVALTLYILTLAPTVTAEDSGELISAAYTLGIPHPPGYPLYCLLGKLFISVFPFGEVAFRMNVLSAGLGATSVVLVFLLSRRLAASLPASGAIALVVAFSPILWSQATMAEVYTLSAVVVLVIVHLALCYLKNPQQPWLWLLCYFAGLSLGAHPSCVLLFPGLLACVLLRDPGILRRPREFLSGVFFALLGFSIYIYLPLRSLADPSIDWGNPETFQGFMAHILRRQYASISSPVELPVLKGLLYLGHLVAFEIGPVLALLSVLGWPALLSFPGAGEWHQERMRARKAFRVTYFLWVLFLSVGLLFFVGLSFQRQTVALNEVFFIPLLLVLSPAAALGLERCARRFQLLSPRLGSFFSQQRARWACALLLPLAFVLAHYGSQDRSGYWIARDYAENILKTLAPGAVYLPAGDYANFPVQYLQVVEGKRPDVLIADKYGYLDTPFLGRLGASEAKIRELRSGPRQEADRWVIDHAGLPVFVNSKRTILEIPTDRFVQVGLLYRVDREREALSKDASEGLWRSYTLRNLRHDYGWVGGLKDISADFILSEILFQRAEFHFDRGENEKAIEVARKVKEVAGDYRECLQNVGALFAERKLPQEAVSFFEEALRVDPTYAQCRKNYAWCLLRFGINLERAVELADQSLKEMPPEPGFLKDLGRAYRKLRRYRNAEDAFKLATELDPQDPEPSKLLGEIAEEDLKAPATARAHYAESLRRKPTQPDLIEKVQGKEARERYEEAARRAVEAMLEPHLPHPMGQEASG